jgi:hypothetical protein
LESPLSGRVQTLLKTCLIRSGPLRKISIFINLKSTDLGPHHGVIFLQITGSSYIKERGCQKGIELQSTEIMGTILEFYLNTV